MCVKGKRVPYMANDVAAVVSRTGSKAWTHDDAARLFEIGEVLRMVSLVLVMITAVHSAMQQRKQYGLVALCFVSIVESLLRLPLACQEDVMKRQILVVVVMYCVALMVFLMPIGGIFGSSVIAASTAIVSLTFALLTEKREA